MSSQQTAFVRNRHIGFSGLKPNFKKSEIGVIGVLKRVQVAVCCFVV